MQYEKFNWSKILEIYKVKNQFQGYCQGSPWVWNKSVS